MKKIWIGLAIFVGLIVALWSVGRLTNALQYFTVSSAANEPTLKLNSTFFASNLVKPQRLDFVCFFATTKLTGRSIRVYRLCGLPGDSLEMRNGILFVNGKNMDAGLSLAHEYLLSKKDYEQFRQNLHLKEEDVFTYSNDSVDVGISDKIIRQLNIPATPFTLAYDNSVEDMDKQIRGIRNLDNFGPVVVPAGKFFVLGDNRHRAEDSRFLGFIDKSDYVATVLWIK